MNNLEKKQARLDKLNQLYEKSKKRTDELARQIKELEKQIETEIMADIFREGKTYKMTVTDWLKMRKEISNSLVEKYASTNKEVNEEGKNEN